MFYRFLIVREKVQKNKKRDHNGYKPKSDTTLCNASLIEMHVMLS